MTSPIGARAVTPGVLPSFLVLVAFLAAVGLCTMLLLVSPYTIWQRLAPVSYAEWRLGRHSGMDRLTPEGCLGTPSATRAWQTIARAGDAPARFQRLLRSQAPGARLYALAGLHATDRAAFAAAVPMFKRDTLTRAGRNDESVAALAVEIETGRVSRTLASAPMIVGTCVE
jgi:hypothetical protein